MRRLLVIYNPNSSQYRHVKTEVLDRLHLIQSMMIGKFEIKKISFEENVERLREFLKDDDYVLAVGGDATAAIALNAIIMSRKNASLAVLPYGNFNDLARTLRLKKLDDVLVESETLKNGKKSLDFKVSERVAKLYPLEVWVDGQFWRYASCYVTIGMTAEAVEIFDERKIRAELQKGKKYPWRSYLYLVGWYFKNRKKKVFVPDFKLNGKLMPKGISDYAAVNGRSMARVMKGGEDYLGDVEFRSEADKLANLWRLTKLMTKSILKRVPGKATGGDVLEFLEPATVELQAEGEYRKFENIKKIEIKKSKKAIKVIQN